MVVSMERQIATVINTHMHVPDLAVFFECIAYHVRNSHSRRHYGAPKERHRALKGVTVTSLILILLIGIDVNLRAAKHTLNSCSAMSEKRLAQFAAAGTAADADGSGPPIKEVSDWGFLADPLHVVTQRPKCRQHGQDSADEPRASHWPDSCHPPSCCSQCRHVRCAHLEDCPYSASVFHPHRQIASMPRLRTFRTPSST